ncbi:MAG: B12-binding domain-containing radical SAM protein [DPANN group archaeon]|nr:B12-binding domain-containing radical SAM protein [DPANN group archaeon]
MKKKVLLIDVYYSSTRTPESISVISKLTHKLWLRKLAKKKNIENLNKKNLLRMFSFGGHIPVTMGLLNISSYLKNSLDKKNCYLIDYFHMGYYLEKYKNKAWDILRKKLKDTVLVGLSCSTPNFYNAIEISSFIKKVDSSILVVIGGHHVSFTDIETLKHPSIDLVVRGEGELSFLQIMDSLHTKNFTKVFGLTYRKNGKIKRNPDQKLLCGADFPSPDFSLIQKEFSDKFVISLSASRGCPFNCSFCLETNFWSHHVRYKPITRFVSEIELMIKRFKNGLIHISDSNFPVSKEYVSSLLSLLNKKNLKFCYSVNIRADLVNNLSVNDLRKMVNSGFKEFLVGVESASDKILKRMNKKETFNDIIKALRKLKRANVPIVKTYWMLGFPGETKKTLEESYNGLKFLIKEKLSDYAIIKLYLPYPGTSPFDNPRKFDFKILTKDWSQYERFSFPPPYSLKDVSNYELLSYLIMMNALQLHAFAKDLKITHKELNNLLVQEIKNG